MIRPKLRPTLSRKVKYWGIAPTAHKKLGREARRGSHDLRRLVGHANFLDILVSELDISDDEDEAASPIQNPTLAMHNEPEKDDVEVEDDVEDEGEHEELDDEDTASDDWSEYDSSDDEDHTLVRTVSRRLLAPDGEVRAQGRSNSESRTENMEDYFQFDHPGPTIIATENVLDLREATQDGEDDKKEAIVSVTVASATLTPLASPTNEIAT